MPKSSWLPSTRQAAVDEGLLWRDEEGRWQVAERSETRASAGDYERLGLPRSLSFENWGEAWSGICIGGTCEGISPYFKNSFKMVIPATIISTIVGALNGYLLSKWRFRGSEVLFGIITLGVFMPGQMVLLPWAITLGYLGLTNTTAGLVLVHVVQGTSFTTLFCRNYYVNIPDDLIKAAHAGYDALLTGEPEEPSGATARELGVHLIAAGHHATERFGVQALAAHLAERFALEWRYVEVDNPV